MSNIVVTAANNVYYYSLLTLISSIHYHSFNSIDKIIVFNLGLTEEEVKVFNQLQKVEVIDFMEENKNFHSKFFDLKSYIFKCFCIKKAGEYGENILWLDAGVMALAPINEIFETISRDDIFLVGDTHLIKKYTHSKCKQIMNATEEELNDTILSAGILGYKNKGKYQMFVDEAFEYSKIEGCVDGNEEDHRHDQSVYSILAARYRIKKHDINKYGYWTDKYRTLETAKQNNAVLFVHRASHVDTQHLRIKNGIL